VTAVGMAEKMMAEGVRQARPTGDLGATCSTYAETYNCLSRYVAPPPVAAERTLVSIPLLPYTA